MGAAAFKARVMSGALRKQACRQLDLLALRSLQLADRVAAIEPSPEVLSWVRSRNIAYAKARKAVAA